MCLALEFDCLGCLVGLSFSLLSFEGQIGRFLAKRLKDAHFTSIVDCLVVPHLGAVRS